MEPLEILGHVLLFFLVFGMSATVDLTCVQKQLRNGKALGMGVLLQFVVLPFLGFATVKMLNLDNAMGLTLLVVTSSPGGSYSNWWCSIFNADLALSVTMTGISTILAIIMLPINLAIYAPLALNDNEVNVMEMLDFGTLLTSIVVVFSAIGMGIMFSIKIDNHNFHIFANRLGSVAGITLIILAGIASNNVDGVGIWERDAKFYFGVAMPCVVALLLSNIMTTYAGLKKPERVTASIECCYQNCGIATSVALTMFKGNDLAEAMGVPFFYGVVEFLLIGMYCLGAWKAGWTKAPPTDPLWKVITVNYEVLLAEKLQKARDGDAEVQLGGDYVDVGKYSPKSGENNGFGAWFLTYCHEPDLEMVDPPPADDVSKDAGDEKKENLVENEEGAVSMKMNARPMFWKSLGYKV